MKKRASSTDYVDNPRMYTSSGNSCHPNTNMVTTASRRTRKRSVTNSLGTSRSASIQSGTSLCSDNAESLYNAHTAPPPQHAPQPAVTPVPAAFSRSGGEGEGASCPPHPAPQFQHLHRTARTPQGWEHWGLTALMGERIEYPLQSVSEQWRQMSGVYRR